MVYYMEHTSNARAGVGKEEEGRGATAWRKEIIYLFILFLLAAADHLGNPTADGTTYLV